MKKYKPMKTINGLYIVADSDCKPYSAKTYSKKENAQKVADRLNKKR